MEQLREQLAKADAGERDALEQKLREEQRRLQDHQRALDEMERARNIKAW